MQGLPLGWDASASRQGQAFGFTAGARERPADEPSLICDDSDSHVMVIAPTGSGKGRNFCVPSLLTHPGGVVAVDVKGELHAITARYRRTLGPVLVLDPFGLTDDEPGSFNPLALIEPRSRAFEDDVYAFANLFAAEAAVYGKDGRFWEDSATDVVAGLLAHVATCEAEKDRSFGRIYELLNTDDTVFDLSVLLDASVRHRFARARLGRFLALPDVTRGGILATVAHQTRLLASEGVRACLAGNTLDLAAMRAGRPFTIYLVFPHDKIVSHAALIRVLLTSIVNLLTSRRNRPRNRTLFLVDEAAQISRVPSLVTATTLGRAFGVRIAWLFQSYAQLRSTYPESHEAILENCGTALTFGKHPTFAMSRTLSETVFGDMSAEALFALGRNEVAVRRAGERSRVARKADYLTDAPFRGRFDANPLHLPVAL